LIVLQIAQTTCMSSKKRLKDVLKDVFKTVPKNVTKTTFSKILETFFYKTTFECLF